MLYTYEDYIKLYCCPVNLYIFALQINNDMKYLEIDFFIDIDAALMDDARALLAEAAGEAGCESFEDSEQGLKAYV